MMSTRDADADIAAADGADGADGAAARALSQADIALAFDLAPVGLCVLRKRVIQRCNEAFASMFGYTPEELAGQSTSMLYPSTAEFENIGERGINVMRDCGLYADERIMKHRDGRLFWCHASGRSLERDDPFGCSVWMFEDISAKRPVTTPLTQREREIAQLLVEGKTSKAIARVLGVSPRTIDAHRARLLRKLKVSTPTELVSRLAGLTGQV
jgi:PAS domain S-box-containing protein